jgi:hypothetical protein
MFPVEWELLAGIKIAEMANFRDVCPGSDDLTTVKAESSRFYLFCLYIVLLLRDKGETVARMQ